MDLFKQGQEVQVRGFHVEGYVRKPNLPENKMEVKFPDKVHIVDKDEVTSIDRIPRKLPVYYQPRLTDEEFIESGIATFEVYRHFKNAKDDFPDHVIDVFTGSLIEDHTYIDDEDGRSLSHYVDVPNPNEGGDDYTNVYQCFDRDEAILFARLNWNADENGMISIISQS